MPSHRRNHTAGKRPVKKTGENAKGILAKEDTNIVIKTVRRDQFDWAVEQIRREYRGQRKVPMPENIKPTLASQVDQPFDNNEWQFEIKWDGYRSLAYVKNAEAELRSRNNLSFNGKYPDLVEALSALPYEAVLDGEIVVLSEEGRSDFGALQSWHRQQHGQLLFFVFDILWFEGIDLQKEALTERQQVLRKILPDGGLIRMSDCIDDVGIAFYEAAKENGLEGIIAKKKASRYKEGQRTTDWLKIKVESRHEAVICGYTKKKGTSREFSSLILGLPEQGGYRFIGNVGTGFTAAVQRELLERFTPLHTKRHPFDDTPPFNAPVQWIQPHLVCEVKYTELTSDGMMRHPSFQGLREDKTAKDINLEPSQKKKLKEKSGGQEFIQAKDEEVSLKIEEHQLIFTNLKKVYWPKEGYTKRDLLNYYHEMAPFIVPYMKGRPQSLNRFPNGINGESFYQKNMKGKVDSWLMTFERFSESDGEAKDFLVCTGEASLLYMANLGCIEMNPWHSRIGSPQMPDWCVIDLDPGEIPFSKVIETALVVRKVLDSLGIPSYPKTSGSTGIHIYIPLGAKYNYLQSRQLAELIANLVHNELPSFTSLLRNPEKRRDKIYIDFLQNREIQTICAPYSVRPKKGATVSAPLDWSEVKPGLKISQFTMKTIKDRVKREGDLFTGVLSERIDLNAVLQQLAALI